MKINNITSYNPNYSKKQNSNRNTQNNVSFGTELPNFPKSLKGLSEEALTKLKEDHTIVKKELEKAQSKLPQSNLSKKIDGYISKVADSKFFKKIMTSSEKSEGTTKKVDALNVMITLGNSAKEAVGTAIYTVQALTNDDLPKDKRKFVGMYDLAVGVVSTSLSLVAGLGMLAVQKDMVNHLLGAKKGATKIPGYAKAFAGITFILPVLVQTIIIKRIVATAAGTAAAGVLKNKLEANEATKNANKQKSVKA